MNEARQIAQFALSGIVRQLQADPRMAEKIPDILAEFKNVVDEVLGQTSGASPNKDELKQAEERDRQILKEKDNVVVLHEEVVKDNYTFVDKRHRT